MRLTIDVLVIGSGIAGLSYALKLAKENKVILITKDQAEETSTRYAQGGIAAVMYDPDSYEKHINDTMIAGDDLSDPNIVKITISESKDRVKELIKWGVDFDKQPGGRYDLAKEGGHSEYRVLHHKDSTGMEIQEKLYIAAKNHPNITILEKYFAIEIITQHHLGIEINRRSSDIVCYGAYVLNPNSGKIDTILSRCTMISTGGAGHAYNNTTNPKVSTGDGIAMAYRAKGFVRGMEFVQFHPTALYNPSEKPSFLITEALRGAGAILKDYQGHEFMHKYDSRGSLASRDIVARAIDNEMKISGEDHVYLDARHIPSNTMIMHFPNIYAKCLQIGIDICKDLIPVVPAAHYLCGGIATNELGETGIKHLFASGECASTGLHGANRLASNSLLESLVFSHRAALKTDSIIHNINHEHMIPDWDDEGTVLNEEMILITQTKKELQNIMSNYVGIVRSNLRLNRALKRLEIIYKETEELFVRSIVTQEICELRNLIQIGYIIIKQAMERKESRGLHFNIDYPKVDRNKLI
ncbi:MAG: L-aspartate oxidase [Bacteroidales bacterium]|nr:L-aspartate oxidase [Bacteroidales bacterium]